VEAASGEAGWQAAEQEIARLEQELAELEARVGERRHWGFPEEYAEARWWNLQLTELIEGLEALSDADTGLLSPDGVSPEHSWSVPRRLAFARRLRAGFAEGGELAQAWAEALPAIRDAYPGLDLTPQMGLVPISPDPESHLWEFAHLMTGEPAHRGPEGKLELGEETGMVLVLLPGGPFWMGAQRFRRNELNYVPNRDLPLAEGPVHEVDLSPFFLSKYEMTQGQWRRLTGRNPSAYGPEGRWNPEWMASGGRPSLLHPVERVNRLDCMAWLPRAALELPSEAQWEYGARAGTQTPWWPGAEKEALEGAANLVDSYALAHGGSQFTEHELWLDDRYTMHAPVGKFRANAFGLHDVAGNVWEWCRDGYDPSFYLRSPRRDPVAPWKDDSDGVFRGGTFTGSAYFARSSYRYPYTATIKDSFLGVRPARVLEP
jgi:formylglycine-generating enzyme required for sulfatase activity